MALPWVRAGQRHHHWLTTPDLNDPSLRHGHRLSAETVVMGLPEYWNGKVVHLCKQSEARRRVIPLWALEKPHSMSYVYLGRLSLD